MRNQILSLMLCITIVALSLALSATDVRAQASNSSRGQINGVVKDQSGAVVSGAAVTLINAQHAVYGTTRTDAEGRFSFANVPTGTYVVETTRQDFASRRISAQVTQGGTTEVSPVLEVIPITDEVTITADTGQAQDRERVAQQVNVISEDRIRLRTTAVLAQVADEEVGVNLQRTSPSMGEVFVRGLTGKNVPVYVDGVRYTTSTQRGGVSTFFNLNEPSSLRSVEILRGPNSAQYGSDSLGGVVQLVSRTPIFGSDHPEFHGEVNTFFTSADLSFGGNTLLSYGTRHFGIYANLASRRVNTLRTADGIDTHSAVTRFLGLPSTVLYGPRMPDTAFTQYGGTVHMNYAPDTSNQLILHYQRSQQDGGKRFDQLLGGDGNLIADLRNLMMDFFYGRYIRQGMGFFDTGSFTFSVNSQREERRNQGGQGNPFGDITHQFERTTAVGFNFYMDKQLTRHNTFLVGGDLYFEGVRAPAHTLNVVTGVDTFSRPRVPNQAHYLTYGLYVQDVWDVVPEKFRVSGALRYGVASYVSRAANSPTIKPLWPNDSLRVADFSGRIGAVLTPLRGFSIAFNYSRGFRAPNITDLGTLGLTGDGFEVDFPTSNALGGLVGTTAGADALSSGVAVEQQRSEISNNFDLGFRLHRGRIETELTGFLIDINDAIVKQALVVPVGAPVQLIDRLATIQPIASQPGFGLVTVPATANPVLVRTNFTNARLWGLEYDLEARINRNWVFNGNFTYIRAEDKATGMPPNIEGGTPPPTAFLSLRYAPTSKRYWVEGYSTLAARQSRLSSLDLSDRRTGAARSRTSIQNFFRRGACVQGLTTPGSTGICGSPGGILIATGETLAQVQNRLLPIGAVINGVLVVNNATGVPLFTHLPGYGLFNVRGGFQFNETNEFSWDFENITDQRYRNPSWGLDGPGRSLTLRYQYKF
ncbi:MAG TPA: TonB-dependent receptor [Pyrinomonadaceae bacterium]